MDELEGLEAFDATVSVEGTGFTVLVSVFSSDCSDSSVGLAIEVVAVAVVVVVSEEREAMMDVRKIW